jgi:hypothetical protein
MMRFFMGKNLRIARDRAWNLTLASRGKDPSFWGPYVEEWQKPPAVRAESQAKWEKAVTSGIGRLLIRKGNSCITYKIPGSSNTGFELASYPFTV